MWDLILFYKYIKILNRAHTVLYPNLELCVGTILFNIFIKKDTQTIQDQGLPWYL